MSEARWPFGKYKGEKVEDLPSDYIEWALGNLEKAPHQAELEAQLELRAGRGVSRGKRD